jgi:membrane protein DedA with SNARE-associated domain
MPTEGLDQIGQWTVAVMVQAGYLGLGLLVALEMVFPPIPSELVLPMAGFLTGQGLLSYPLAVLAATIGSAIGSLILYGIGAAVGEQRLREATRRWGKWFMLDEGDFDKAHQWFTRWGSAAVFLGRLAPGVRSVVSIPAGVSRMPIGKFLLYSTAGSALWNAFLIGLGFLLGAAWGSAEVYVKPLTFGVLALGAAAGLIFAWKRVSSRVLRKDFSA